eukprot:TRINITY_DN3372_c0_g1_i2.p1 TRINITY_DN3372_c0_g1~~TRINITY_DN3372_c0_g1_i2.p1  ORF type:complete len:471 (-),score=111.19 TRINITY_DN3372_c0_g1_i2:32-1444(-)
MAEKRKAETELIGFPDSKRARSLGDAQGHHYNIFVGSWNVNQKNPKQVDWKKWLCPPIVTEETQEISHTEAQEKIPVGLQVTSLEHNEVDLYVISFQEVLTVDNVSPNPPPLETERFDNWNSEFMAYIGTCRSKPLVPVFSASLGGTGLFIFSTPEVKAEISEEDSNLVEVGRSKTTIKGGVCYRCKLGDLSVSFAGVHFTADQEQENVEARIQDYHTINNSVFPGKQLKFLEDHSFSCIAGDVNFRINLPRQEIADHVKVGAYDHLLEHDQLNIARREGKAFVEYSEGRLNFPPTYKYEIGTDEFDLLEPPKKRSPAYTDRIFFQHHNIPSEPSKVQVVHHHYALGRLTESDHKPVSCYVTVKVGEDKVGNKEVEVEEEKACDAGEQAEEPKQIVEEDKGKSSGQEQQTKMVNEDEDEAKDAPKQIVEEAKAEAEPEQIVKLDQEPQKNVVGPKGLLMVALMVGLILWI